MDTSAYHEYLQSDKWKSLRLLCLTRDQYRCRVCNESEHLEVHHRTYERIGQEQLDDLTTLCDKCHELYTAQTIKPSESKSIGEGVMELLQEYDARKAAGDSFRGIPTGFLDLDNFTAGFQNSEFIVLAARPSVGKTAFALNIARHAVIEETLPVLFVSLEQPRVEIAERLLCCQARVDAHRLRRGHLNADDIPRIKEAGEILSEAKLFIDETPGQNLLRIAVGARRLVKEKGVRLVIIDSLNSIDPDNRRESRQEQVAGFSRRLKLLARELEVPVIALAQVNRESDDRQDHRPRLSDLRESGAIEQHADTVIMLHRPDYSEPGLQEGLIEVIVAKQRNGPTGDVSLIYLKQFMRFENFAIEHSPSCGGI
jgi:replicative DNA helicase